MELCKTTETISISMPSWLLELIDIQCQKTDLPRSALITRAVRKYLLTQSDNPTIWKEIYEALKGK